MKKNITIGHQAPKRWRINECNSIEIDGDLHYCYSHNFVYNSEEEERKLYNGEACYYTDQFQDGRHNFYKNTYLFWQRWTPISIKAAIRRTLSTKGIPAGTIVTFNKSYYHPGKKFNNNFNFKVKKENPIDFKFEVSRPSFFKNFKNCQRSQELIEALRANGFLVQVLEDNNNFISSLVATAAAYTGQESEITKEAGEVAIAYGYGKKIGFSSSDNSLFGYYNGCENILWDKFGEFCKWSRCLEIPKNESIESVLKILMEPNKEEEE